MADALTLLLVDDDEIDRMAVQRALKAAGVEARFVECGDAASALRVLERGRFDCVFLDMRLPDRDGLSLLRALRAAGDLTPVISLTGFGDERVAVELMKAGASDYFSKAALNGERLAQALRQALRLRAAEEAAVSARLSLQRHAAQLQSLARLSLELHAGRSLDSIAGLVAAGARDLLSCAGAGVATAHVHLRAAREGAPVALPLPAALPGGCGPVSAAALGPLERGLLPEGAQKEPREWTSATIPASGAGAAGLVYAFDQEGGAFGEGDVAVLGQLAQLASVALENARLVAQLQQASRSRDDLLAIVSHDLRSPLNVITMASSLLQHQLAAPAAAFGKEGAQPAPAAGFEKARVAADRIRRASRHMTTLVNDLLDASRIEAGALQLRLEPTSSGELLDEVVETFRPVAAGKGVNLERAAGQGAQVHADRARLFQVFSNLVGNAIKFTPAGGLISVGAAEGDGLVTFAVQDSGPGIPAQHLPHLFDRYWQPRGTASREGAGLGLFIAKGIVEAHRGCISVQSEPGRGARFTFTVARPPAS